MSRSSLSALRDDLELDTAVKRVGGVIRAGADQVGVGADAGGDQSAVQAWVVSLQAFLDVVGTEPGKSVVKRSRSSPAGIAGDLQAGAVPRRPDRDLLHPHVVGLSVGTRVQRDGTGAEQDIYTNPPID
jgi:hypothetical protein